MKCHKAFRHHHFHCLGKKEKLCIAGIIAISFMRGMCIGLYLSRK